MYDRELAVSERRVKPASILRNSSLILGKQIIHILPEGFVQVMEPEKAGLLTLLQVCDTKSRAEPFLS